MSSADILKKGERRALAGQEKPSRQKNQKLLRLPDNATISKRPIHHPSIPTPFASSSAPKVLYIKNSSPFIPAVKRVRSLLSEISRRSEQSSQSIKQLKPSGHLNNKVIEQAIAESSNGGAGKGLRSQIGGEEVFLKATGRAIPRALSIGNHFQAQIDCRVRIDLGSVLAIDDIELEPNQEGDVVMAERDEEKVKKDRGITRTKMVADEDIPETRIRNLSTVTVAIRLK